MLGIYLNYKLYHFICINNFVYENYLKYKSKDQVNQALNGFINSLTNDFIEIISPMIINRELKKKFNYIRNDFTYSEQRLR